ncbi:MULTISPECIES: NUDIX hydrolase [unclassified Gordonia (in: high G+C Gram-positive bacteria)]|uniref:NUDIX hydrolase n=1 Tax=unclassified Gordonia (in: high G+C Gram-positive bacteria) TaxID=2657482 RepID=UPI001FFF7DC4|nr:MULTISPECIES: NUDIX domain-containing protein [unclassified Gordonia (in: high G+C Gram-positive bacteria)]UQE76668.1 NUDIX domain-containing protein [Gordonia sp. PP30]
MKTVVAASAVLVDDDGRVLLVKRGHEPEKGHWSVPGGRVEPGETPAQAAVREVREETGLDVRVGDELWTAIVPFGDDSRYEVHDFAATVLGGELRSGDDADDARWVAPDQLETLPLSTGLLGYLRGAGIIPPEG